VVELWFYTPAVGGSIPSAPTSVDSGQRHLGGSLLRLAAAVFSFGPRGMPLIYVDDGERRVTPGRPTPVLKACRFTRPPIHSLDPATPTRTSFGFTATQSSSLSVSRCGDRLMPVPEGPS
jgi:hypothetical protein